MERLITQTEEIIYALIPFAKKNAITRSELVELTSLPDRTVRKAVANLRENGFIICSSSQKKGYWKPTKKSEVEAFVNEMNSRAISCLKSAKFGREYMKTHENQLKVLDYE